MAEGPVDWGCGGLLSVDLTLKSLLQMGAELR